MKKIGLIVFVAAIILGVAVSSFFSWGKASGEMFDFSLKIGREKGSGRMAVDVRDVRDFESIDVSSVFQVEVVAQGDFHVEVEADDNLLQYVRTEVSNGELQISLDKSVKASNPLRVRITAPNIERLEASGASKVNITDLKNSEFVVDASGASKIQVSGETAGLTVDVSGASHVNAVDLNAVNATVDASGASKVNISVSGELRSEASGASNISYTGTPTNVYKKTSGASSISQK